MATYKLVNADQLDSDLAAIGDAIRSKGGTVEALSFPGEMVSAISAISTGVELNFEVVPNPQPSVATENTIWVDTDRINNYYFSATQPEGMVDYDVWFLAGTFSPVEFNALKKGGIQVYPLSAKQMVSGVLKDVTAESYIGGKWAEWFLGLVNNGVIVGNNQFELHSGLASTTTIDGVLRCVITGLANANYYTEEKIDFTDISHIVIDIEGGMLQYDAYFGLSSDKTQSSGENVDVFWPSIKIPKGTVSKATYSLDLSTVDKQYYFGLTMAYTSSIISDIYQHSGIDIKNIKFVRG